MILSEFAGAAQSLNGSLIINPCMFFTMSKKHTDFAGDVQSTADAIHAAVEMSPEQRKSNWEKLYKVGQIKNGRSCADSVQYVSKYTAEAWGVSFVNERKFSIAVRTELIFTVNRVNGAPPQVPIPGGARRKSGSLSRASSKTSSMRVKA
jgi:trehalose 6-phosphate synthase